MHRILTLLFILTQMPLLRAQDPFGDPAFAGGNTKATVLAESTTVEAGDFFRIAFTLDLKPHFHAFYKNGGTLGQAPSIEWTLPEGLSAEKLMFPRPSAIKVSSDEGDSILYGYEGSATFLVKVFAKEDLENGQVFPIEGTFLWQECDENGCFPKTSDFSFAIEVAEETNFPEDREEIFAKTSAFFPQESSAWAVEASEVENKITLQVSFPDALTMDEPVYFFSDDAQIDSQAAQKVTLEAGKVTLHLARNEGNENLFISAVEPKDSLKGLLTFSNEDGLASVEIDTPLVADADLNAGGSHTSVGFIPATAANRAAGAEVYDVNKVVTPNTLGGGKEKKLTFFYGLGLLFVGGLLLNLMPCVFPVLGLKVMGFVAQAGEDESKIKKHGMVFGLGLLVAMWILSAIVISLGLKWGEQLADPVFLVTMIMFFYLMGLNLFGLFEVGTSLTGVGGELQAKKGYSGSFFSGVLTTLVATPCSGPFLGIAMAFALALPAAQAFVAFTVFGLGIASPYILLSFFPALIKKLPKPGAWMVSFKQIMSFFLIATAVFFMKAYHKLVGDVHFNYFLFALVMVGMGVYFYGRWGTPMVAKLKRMITGYGLAGLLTFGGIAWAYSTAKPPEKGLAWREWYPGIVELTRPKKRIMWVDYTAEW